MPAYRFNNLLQSIQNMIQQAGFAAFYFLAAFGMIGGFELVGPVRYDLIAYGLLAATVATGIVIYLSRFLR